MEILLVNSVVIQQPVEEVFEYCFDLQNELKWNPDGLLSLEELTPRPIAVGTKIPGIVERKSTYDL